MQRLLYTVRRVRSVSIAADLNRHPALTRPMTGRRMGRKSVVPRYGARGVRSASVVQRRLVNAGELSSRLRLVDAPESPAARAMRAPTGWPAHSPLIPNSRVGAVDPARYAYESALRGSPGKLQIQLVARPRNQLSLDREVARFWRPLALSAALSIPAWSPFSVIFSLSPSGLEHDGFDEARLACTA